MDHFYREQVTPSPAPPPLHTPRVLTRVPSHFYREQLDMLDEQLSTEQKERQFREKVQRSTAMKLEAEMRAEGAALLDGLKGQLAHMAAVDYGVPTSPY